jgi:hypothetical protein
MRQATRGFEGGWPGNATGMKRCPACGSLRLLWALDGTRAFCARCHRRLSRDYARPLFSVAGGAADARPREAVKVGTTLQPARRPLPSV